MKSFKTFLTENVKIDNSEFIVVDGGAGTSFRVTAPIEPQSPNGDVTIVKGSRWDEYGFEDEAEYKKLIQFLTSDASSVSFENGHRSLNLQRSGEGLVVSLHNPSMGGAWTAKISSSDAESISNWVKD